MRKLVKLIFSKNIYTKIFNGEYISPVYISESLGKNMDDLNLKIDIIYPIS